MKQKEGGAREALKVANDKAGKLLQQVSDLKLREAMAMNAATTATKDVNALKQKISDLEKDLELARSESLQSQLQVVSFDTKVRHFAVYGGIEKLNLLVFQVTEVATEKVNDVVQKLQNELLLAKKREAKAKDIVVSSTDRVEFFYRRMEMMKQREEKAKKVTEERIELFTKQASELRSKLEAADVLAAESEKKIETLSGQVEDLSKKEKAAMDAAKAAGDWFSPWLSFVKNVVHKQVGKVVGVAIAKAVVGGIAKTKLGVGSPLPKRIFW